MFHFAAAANLRERACSHVRNAVFTRSLRPGVRIDPGRAAEHAGVPPAAMREALANLADNGWLERPSPETFIVKPVTAADIRETAQRHLSLEYLIIEQAMPRLTRRQFEYLDALTAQHRRAGLAQSQAEELTSLGRTFHLYLASLSGVTSLVESMRVILELGLRLGIDPRRVQERFPQSLHEHEAVVNALRDADCAAAKRAVRLHLDNEYSAMLRSAGNAHA